MPLSPNLVSRVSFSPVISMQDHMEQTYNPRPRIVSRPSGKRSCSQAQSPPRISQGNNPSSERKSAPSKPTICFDCGLISLVPLTAISATCHHCSAYIRLDDITLHNRSLKRTVQTWGNVTVKHDSNLTHLTIRCKNLTILGKISGNILCTGICSIQTSQIFKGSLKAHTLEIDKRADVTFPTPVEIHQAIIKGTLRGSIHCKGTITLCKYAKILGDVYASNLIFEEGASHFGHFYKAPHS